MLLGSPWSVQVLLALSVLTLGLDSEPQNAPRVFLSFKGKRAFLFGFLLICFWFSFRDCSTVCVACGLEEPCEHSGVYFSHMLPSGFHD